MKTVSEQSPQTEPAKKSLTVRTALSRSVLSAGAPEAPVAAGKREDGGGEKKKRRRINEEGQKEEGIKMKKEGRVEGKQGRRKYRRKYRRKNRRICEKIAIKEKRNYAGLSTKSDARRG